MDTQATPNRSIDDISDERTVRMCPAAEASQPDRSRCHRSSQYPGLVDTLLRSRGCMGTLIQLVLLHPSSTTTATIAVAATISHYFYVAAPPAPAIVTNKYGYNYLSQHHHWLKLTAANTMISSTAPTPPSQF